MQKIYLLITIASFFLIIYILSEKLNSLKGTKEEMTDILEESPRNTNLSYETSFTDEFLKQEVQKQIDDSRVNSYIENDILSGKLVLPKTRQNEENVQLIIPFLTPEQIVSSKNVKFSKSNVLSELPVVKDEKTQKYNVANFKECNTESFDQSNNVLTQNSCLCRAQDICKPIVANFQEYVMSR